jgi:hypothetical protein
MRIRSISSHRPVAAACHIVYPRTNLRGVGDGGGEADPAHHRRSEIVAHERDLGGD